MNHETIRSKVADFKVSFIGYRKDEVASYLGRVALLFQVIGDEGVDATELPPIPTGFRPNEIRIVSFGRTLRGLKIDEVRSFLEHVGDELEARLE